MSSRVLCSHASEQVSPAGPLTCTPNTATLTKPAPSHPAVSKPTPHPSASQPTSPRRVLQHLHWDAQGGSGPWLRPN